MMRTNGENKQLMRLFEDNLYWVRVNDGNETAFRIFQRHYSFRKWRIRSGKNGKRIIGPGETILLLGKDAKALFAWKKQKYSQDGQTGINCCIFRNEGNMQSSKLILQAEQIAWQRWPGERLFTYVNQKKIRSTNPGYCYKMAGWKFVGITKARELLIFEKYCVVSAGVL